MPGAPQPAVWREQHVPFAYPGRTVRYSCEGLREKLRGILLELGARRDLTVDTEGCDHRAPRLALTFSVPVLPTGDMKPQGGADLSAVDARFERFLLTSDAFHNFGPADCELVEEFVRQVLPKLATREVNVDLACLPYERDGSHYAVHGQILRALPRTDQAAR